MELREIPEFSGPDSSDREIAAVVLSALVESTHSRGSVVCLVTEERN